MTVQTIPIHYDGAHVADVTCEGWQMLAPLTGRRWNDPDVYFVSAMCGFAQMVLAGDVTPHYDDTLAASIARAALVPGELAERPTLDIGSAAEALGIPARELTPAKLALARPLYAAAER